MTEQELATLNARVWPYAEVEDYDGPFVGLTYTVFNRVTGLDALHTSEDKECIRMAESIFNRYKGSE